MEKGFKKASLQEAGEIMAKAEAEQKVKDELQRAFPSQPEAPTMPSDEDSPESNPAIHRLSDLEQRDAA